LEAVERIYATLSTLSAMGITLGGDHIELTLVGYTDADWAGDVDTRRICLRIQSLGAQNYSYQRRFLLSLVAQTILREYWFHSDLCHNH
jgi:hypothetical protein